MTDNLKNLNNKLEIFAANLDFLLTTSANISSQKTHQDNGLVIAIEAPWGTGKSFFIDWYIGQLESKETKDGEGNKQKKYFIAQHKYEHQESFGEIRTVIEEVEGAEKIPVIPITFNAWENDYIEPLTALIGQTCEQLEKINTEKITVLREKAKVLLSGMVNTALNFIPQGKNTKGAITDLQATANALSEKQFDSFIDNYQANFANINNFKDALTKVGGENTLKLIFIDELDRCSPAYAVKFLEVVKHFFNAKNTVFIVAVDRKNFTAVIKHFYGNDFDAKHYLSRFFDFELQLPVGGEDYKRKLLEQIFSGSSDYATREKAKQFIGYLIYLSENLNISSRELIKTINNLMILLDINSFRWKWHELAELIILKIHDRNLYKQLIELSFEQGVDTAAKKFFKLFNIELPHYPQAQKTDPVGEHFVNLCDTFYLIAACQNKEKQAEEYLIATYQEQVEVLKRIKSKLPLTKEHIAEKKEHFAQFFNLIDSFTYDYHTLPESK